MLARRAAVLSASAVLLLSPFGATASAQPADAPTQLGAHELPAELVEAIDRDLQMTPQEYLDRAATAQQLSSYASTFRADHPDAFAGAWIGEDGEEIVAVTSSDAADAARQDGYTTRMAPVSAAGLEQGLSDVNTWIATLPRELSSQINSAAIDFLNNRIVIDVVNSPIGRALNLPTIVAGVKVVLSPGSGGPVDGRPMGGDTYVTTAGPLRETPTDRIGVCSFGFNGTDADGSAVNISAGHCNPEQGTASSVYLPDRENIDASEEIGRFDRSAVGSAAGGLDYSVIALNDKGVAAGLDRPTVRGANGTTLDITGTARPVVGAPICKSGQSSSFTCGLVVADTVETQLLMEDGTSRTVRGFAGTACTLAGDSRGAIVTGSLALGVTSGSNASMAPNCTEANLVLSTEGGTANLGIPVVDILDAEPGLNIRTATRD